MNKFKSWLWLYVVHYYADRIVKFNRVFFVFKWIGFNSNFLIFLIFYLLQEWETYGNWGSYRSSRWCQRRIRYRYNMRILLYGYSDFLESRITSKIINDVLYFAEHLLKIQLTRVEQFHSHLEPMRLIKKDLFNEQVIKNTHVLIDSNINVNYFVFLTI